MSLKLNIDSPTEPLCSMDQQRNVQIGSETVGVKDFCMLVHYVLTNMDLAPNDPRRQLVDCVRAMREEDGFNVGGKRLESNLRPISPLEEERK